MIKSPQTTLYYTPIDAYMIISRSSENYSLHKSARHRNAGLVTYGVDCIKQGGKNSEEYQL
jgi:hypothetical protein